MLIPKSSHTKIRKWRKQSKNTDTKTIQAQRQIFQRKRMNFSTSGKLMNANDILNNSEVKE